MNSQDQQLDRFRDEYLEYTDGLREDPPSIIDLGEDLQPRAMAFIKSIQTCRGVDPRAPRPTIEELLDKITKGWDQRTGR